MTERDVLALTSRLFQAAETDPLPINFGGSHDSHASARRDSVKGHYVEVLTGPHFFEVTDDFQAFILAHEVAHCVLNHINKWDAQRTIS